MIEDKGPGLSPLTSELLSFQVQPQQPQLEIVGIQLETGTSTGPDRWIQPRMPHLLAGAEENCYRPTKVILESFRCSGSPVLVNSIFTIDRRHRPHFPHLLHSNGGEDTISALRAQERAFLQYRRRSGKVGYIHHPFPSNNLPTDSSPYLCTFGCSSFNAKLMAPRSD